MSGPQNPKGERKSWHCCFEKRTGGRKNVHLRRKKEMEGTEKQNKEIFQAAAAISSQGSFSHTVDTKVPLPLLEDLAP